MEDAKRIVEVEKELALINQTQKSMSTSLERISDTLEKMSSVHIENEILKNRVAYMDVEIREAFNRNDTRISKIESNLSRLMWMAITPLVLGLIGLVIKTS